MRVEVYSSNSLNERFRRIAMRVYGYGAGPLSKAAEEAFVKWCSEHEHSNSRKSGWNFARLLQDQLSGQAESHNPTNAHTSMRQRKDLRRPVLEPDRIE